MATQSKAFKLRIYPNKEQKEYLDNCFRCSNFIFNYFLNQQEEITNILKFYGFTKDEIKIQRKEQNLYFNRFDASKLVTQLKKEDKYSFLRVVDSTSTTYTLKALEKAFDGIHKQGGGYPKYKKMGVNDSFTGQIMYEKEKCKFLKFEPNKIWNYISLPKLKGLKTKVHYKELLSINNIKYDSYTISKNSLNHYYISFGCRLTIPEVTQRDISEEKSLGIDFGVERPITTSDESDFNNKLYSDRFDLIKDKKDELKRLQQILAKKKQNNPNWKKSNKYKRIKLKISKLHDTIANIRSDRQHNITKSIVNSGYDTIVIEDLKVKNMMARSAKGKSNNKSGLNRVMSDVGIGEMVRQLEYKASWLGKNVVKVDPKYTSQECNNCGHISKDNRVSQDKFKCVNCGHTDNADLNAAKNIKEKYFKKNLVN